MELGSNFRTILKSKVHISLRLEILVASSSFFFADLSLIHNSFVFSQLVNRQKASKKKGPAPLTAAMLNELNKNHMGGIENYGNEDLYNIDDGWGHEEKEPPYSKHEFKSKVLFYYFPHLKN